MNDAPAPDVIETVVAERHALGVHLQYRSGNTAQLQPLRRHRRGDRRQIDADEEAAVRRQQLGVRTMAHADLEHVLVGKLIERNKALERNFPPRRKFARGGQKAIVDLFEIGRVARRVVETFAPVVAHRRGFPPRPVGCLPTLALGLVTRRLDGPVKSGGFRFGRLMRRMVHSPAEVGRYRLAFVKSYRTAGESPRDCRAGDRQPLCLYGWPQARVAQGRLLNKIRGLTAIRGTGPNPMGGYFLSGSGGAEGAGAAVLLRPAPGPAAPLRQASGHSTSSPQRADR